MVVTLFSYQVKKLWYVYQEEPVSTIKFYNCSVLNIFLLISLLSFKLTLI